DDSPQPDVNSCPGIDSGASVCLNPHKVAVWGRLGRGLVRVGGPSGQRNPVARGTAERAGPPLTWTGPHPAGWHPGRCPFLSLTEPFTPPLSAKMLRSPSAARR